MAFFLIHPRKSFRVLRIGDAGVWIALGYMKTGDEHDLHVTQLLQPAHRLGVECFSRVLRSVEDIATLKFEDLGDQVPLQGCLVSHGVGGDRSRVGHGSHTA